MMNNTNLIGRPTKDPILKNVNGNTVTSFTLAVKRKNKDIDGNHQSDFIQIVIWGKTAENFCKWARKGTLVSIEGSIRTRYYDSDQKQRVYVTEVLADSFAILEKKKETPDPLNTPIYDPFNIPPIPPDDYTM